jgi:hypothetical protein
VVGFFGGEHAAMIRQSDREGSGKFPWGNPYKAINLSERCAVFMSRYLGEISILAG